MRPMGDHTRQSLMAFDWLGYEALHWSSYSLCPTLLVAYLGGREHRAMQLENCQEGDVKFSRLEFRNLKSSIPVA